MTFGTTLLISVIMLTVLILYGVPIPYAFAAPVVLIVLVNDINPQMLLVTTYGKVYSLVLLAIPFFIMAGVIMEKGKIGTYLVDWIECFTGRIKGGLAAATVVASAVFGSVCGSGSATVACIGGIMAPRMKASNYNPGIIGAVICCSGPLGLLIPPSAIQILYAWSTNQSVLACFLATVCPGVLLVICMSITSVILIKRDKQYRLPDPVILPAPERRKKFIRVTRESIPALIMPVIVLGGIYGGIMTPTEAGAVAIIYAIPVAVFYYKGMKLRQLKEVLTEAGITTGAILCLLTFVSIMSRLFLQEGLPQIILNALTMISQEQWAILLMINVILILLGMITDDICGTLIAAPILVPICLSIGVSPIHFAAILGVNLGMGNITPPCAPFIFLASRTTGIPAASIMKYSAVFIVTSYIPVLILTTYIPDLSLWLPNMVLGDKLAL
ncbi:MAG: TRAP transporter large permease [Clostridia bacterium]|nr:TRAP transporter large permease [Clostridia bacterium]